MISLSCLSFFVLSLCLIDPHSLLLSREIVYIYISIDICTYFYMFVWGAERRDEGTLVLIVLHWLCMSSALSPRPLQFHPQSNISHLDLAFKALWLISSTSRSALISSHRWRFSSSLTTFWTRVILSRLSDKFLSFFQRSSRGDVSTTSFIMYICMYGLIIPVLMTMMIQTWTCLMASLHSMIKWVHFDEYGLWWEILEERKIWFCFI